MTALSVNGPLNTNDFELGVPGFCYSDLFDAVRLKELADVFYEELAKTQPVLGPALRKYIDSHGLGYEKRAESQLLTDAAPHLSSFLARLFGIEGERADLEKSILSNNPIWKYKFFVQRRAIKTYKQDAALELNYAELDRAVTDLRMFGFDDTLVLDDELAIATIASQLIDAEELLAKEEAEDPKTLVAVHKAYEKLKDKSFGKTFSEFVLKTEGTGELLTVKAALGIVEAWSAIEFYKKKKRWKAFKTPHALDYQNLVHLIHPRPELPNVVRGREEELRRRDGFKLTDEIGRASCRE